MTKSYQIIYEFIMANMDKDDDGIHTNCSTIVKRTGICKSIVYQALKYFRQNRIFDIVRFGNGYLIIKDLSKVDNYIFEGKKTYRANVNVVFDDIEWMPEEKPVEPMLDLAFSEEGV